MKFNTNPFPLRVGKTRRTTFIIVLSPLRAGQRFGAQLSEHITSNNGTLLGRRTAPPPPASTEWSTVIRQTASALWSWFSAVSSRTALAHARLLRRLLGGGCCFDRFCNHGRTQLRRIPARAPLVHSRWKVFGMPFAITHHCAAFLVSPA